MDTESEVTRIVRSWLRADEHVSADRVLDDVLAVLDANTQRRSRWPARRFADMNTFARLAIAAAVVLVVAVVAVVGIDRLPSLGVVGGPATSATPSPLPSPSSRPSSSPPPVARYPQHDPSGRIPSGRHSVTVDGIPLSFDMPTEGWEGREVYMSKSTEGPQGAEAVLFWATFPGGWVNSSLHTGAYIPCIDWLGSPVGRSVADLAAAVSSVSGTDVVSGPTDVSVGGHAAEHVELFLTYSAEACGQGFFYAWDEDKDPRGGAFWTGMIPGDTVRVWVVDVDGTLLFIEAATHWNAGPAVGLEIQQIVDSIRFE